MLFIIKIIVGIIIKQIPPEPGRRLSRWYTTCHHRLLSLGTVIIIIIARAPGASSNSCRGSSQSQEGSSSLLSVRGPLFWLGPICSCEELWFLVVLDTASPLLPSCTPTAVLLSIVSLKSSTTSSCNGRGCNQWSTQVGRMRRKKTDRAACCFRIQIPLRRHYL